jgi:hypothetical protein
LWRDQWLKTWTILPFKKKLQRSKLYASKRAHQEQKRMKGNFGCLFMTCWQQQALMLGDAEFLLDISEAE